MGCIGSKEKAQPAAPKKRARYTVRLIGDANVGKSSLLLAWADGTFSGQTVPTIGDEERREKDLTVGNEQVTLMVLDTAGQEKYALITSSQYKEAEGFFLCFEISDRASFQHVEKWIEQIEQYARKSVAMLLVGLKSDLDRKVTAEEAQEFANIHQLRYLEASSKTLANVDQVFLTMAQAAHEAAEAAAQTADE